MKFKILLSLISTFQISQLFAQVNVSDIGTATSSVNNSSYSYFGLGDEIYCGNVEAIGRAGLATPVINYLSPNFMNSASFFHSKLSTFQIAVKLTEKQQQSGLNQNWSNNGALNYASLSFPITKWWGSGFGLMPAYSKGYDISSDTSNNSFGSANYFYTGKGSMNKIVWSNGINPFKWFGDSLAEDFSIGLGAAYFFGNNKSFDRVVFNNYQSLGYYNQILLSEEVYEGFQFNIGALHKIKLNKNYDLTLGTSYELQNTIKAQTVQQSYNYITSTPITDSVYYYAFSKKIKMPAKFSIGSTLIVKNNLVIGLEYRNTNWSAYQNGEKANYLKNSSTYICGIEYNPHSANSNFLKNTNYRMGVRYTKNPYSVNGNNISERAFNIGFGIPIKKSYSTANIGLEYMKRGTKNNNLVLENFFSAYFSLTINDRWFIKQKYD